VVIELAVVVAAVKAHVGPLDVWTRVEFADLLEAHNLRPESVRLLHIANIQDKVINPHRGHGRAGRSDGVGIVCHTNLPLAIVHAADEWIADC
jgi:hypothetical protein